ncbi:MAG: hypothetical protein ACKVQK_07325 [Burkholderiales bacterium]
MNDLNNRLAELRVNQQDYSEARAQRLRLLQNMNLATDDGVLNLAGVLLFA